MMNGVNPVANQLQFNSSAKDEGNNMRGGVGNATEFKDNNQNHIGAGLQNSAFVNINNSNPLYINNSSRQQYYGMQQMSGNGGNPNSNQFNLSV